MVCSKIYALYPTTITERRRRRRRRCWGSRIILSHHYSVVHASRRCCTVQTAQHTHCANQTYYFVNLGAVRVCFILYTHIFVYERQRLFIFVCVCVWCYTKTSRFISKNLPTFEKYKIRFDICCACIAARVLSIPYVCVCVSSADILKLFHLI